MCCSAVRRRAEREPLTNTKNVWICACMRQPLTLCSFRSKLICLLTRLDGKRPEGERCISRWESPLCCHHTAFLLTGHAQKATPHAPATPIPFRACLNQSVRGGSGFFFSLFFFLPFDLQSQAMGTAGWQERKGGGPFFLKALWVAELICHSWFPLWASPPSHALQLPNRRDNACLMINDLIENPPFISYEIILYYRQMLNREHVLCLLKQANNEEVKSF